MIYGQLNKQGKFIKAPKTIRHNKRVIHNPHGEHLIEAGYNVLIENEKPEDYTKKDYKEKYEQHDGYILLTWERKSLEEIAEEEAIEKEQYKPTEYETLLNHITNLYSKLSEQEELLNFILEHDNGKYRKDYEEKKKHNREKYNSEE